MNIIINIFFYFFVVVGSISILKYLMDLLQITFFDDYITKREKNRKEKQLNKLIDKIRNLKMIPLLTEDGDLFTDVDTLLNSKYVKNKDYNFYYHLFFMIENNNSIEEEIPHKLFIYNSGLSLFNIELILEYPDLNPVLTDYFNPIYEKYGNKYKNYKRKQKIDRLKYE